MDIRFFVSSLISVSEDKDTKIRKKAKKIYKDFTLLTLLTLLKYDSTAAHISNVSCFVVCLIDVYLSFYLLFSAVYHNLLYAIEQWIAVRQHFILLFFAGG